MELFRVLSMCALIFVSCTGLGAAGFWVTTHTDEPITIREVRMVMRALSSSVLAIWILLLITPDELVRTVAIFFVIYAGIVLVVLGVAHFKIIRPRKQEDPFK